MVSLASAQQISDSTLVQEMTDLSFLTHRSHDRYTAAQASSYDRASVKPGTESWFANGDAGQFIRSETNDGRKEFVMADLKGPGSVTRIWSANPRGTIHFYFDGEAVPRLSAPMQDLLSGKVWPFSDPLSYVASHGWNIYYPFPYAKSLKITAEDPQSLYYHVDYRTFEGAPRVESFSALALTMGRMHEAYNQLGESAGRVGKLLEAGPPPMPEKPVRFTKVKPQSEFSSGEVKGTGMITGLRFRIPLPLVQTFRAMDWTDAFQPHNVLQNLILEMEFDGETTVRAPLGAFFADNPGVAPYTSYPMSVSKDGVFTCRFPMPVTKSFRIHLKNVGKVEVPVSVDWDFKQQILPPNTYHFHAQWDGTHSRTRPMRDMHLLDVQGEGKLVGISLHVGNPVKGWWGEGDEKVYVDGETFPSTFGTGTEDYFGYAWSSPDLFDRPYHGQPISDGKTNFGHSAIHRWHILDNIPFQKGIKFDLEMWHWADCVATYDWTAYWYAKPGSTGNHPIPMAIRLPEALLPPAPVKGAFEGENLKNSATGGKLENQTGFDETSGGAQLWWTYPNPHDRLTLELPVATAGKYELVGNFCHAMDYGIHQIWVNGIALPPRDFFQPEGVTWKLDSLGVFDFPAGKVKIEVECIGHRQGARPGNMFGLDYFLLKPKG